MATNIRNTENSFTDVALLDTTLNMVPCGLCRLTLDSKLSICAANDSFYSLFHYTKGQALYAKFTNLRFILLEDDFSSLLEKIQQALAEHHDLFQAEFRCTCRNGQIKHMSARCYLQRTADAGLIWYFSDMTQFEYMQDKVRLSVEMCNAASHQSNTVLAYYDFATAALTFPFSLDQTWELPSVIYDVPNYILESKNLTSSSRKLLEELFHLLTSGESCGFCAIQACTTQSKQYFWFGVQYTLVEPTDNSGAHAIITIKDITDQREKEIAYENWLQNYAELKQDCFAYFECDLTNDRLEKVETANSLICQLVKETSTYSGLHAYAAFHLVHDHDKDRFFRTFTREHLLAVYYTGQYRVSSEFRHCAKDGSPVWYSCSIQLVSDPYAKSVRAFVTLKNIDTEKQQLLRLEESSRRDALTGLLNRRALTEKVCQALKNHSDALQAFVIMDLDHFKHINDSNGHQFGDKVLKDVSTTLQECVSPTDICGRLGGDEFVVFLQDISSQEALAEQISLISAHICHRYTNSVSLSGCMGVAVVPKDGSTFEELYKKSDVALYKAKHIGMGNYVFSNGN